MSIAKERIKMRSIFENDADEARENFGRILFGDLKQADEKDTEFESQVINNIAEYIRTGSEMGKVNTVRVLEFLNKFKEIFPDDLYPDSDEVWRGTKISKELWNKIQYSEGEKHNRTKWIEIDFVYTPRSKLSSWTTSFDVALSFANEESNLVDQMPALITAFADDTFILSSEITNLLAVDVGHPAENEIMRIGNTPINATLVIENNLAKYRINNYSVKNQIDIIHEYPLMIQYIKDPEENVQMAAVRFSLQAIKYIKNPTEKVQLYVIKRDPSLIAYIKNPTPKVLKLYHRIASGI